jgi:hypothetical protein
MIPTRRRVRPLAAVVAAGVVGAGIVVGALFVQGPDRQQIVAERGAVVMPFDLDATTHHFVPTVDGGVQTVVADDPTDAGQVQLVQSHLQGEAEAFARGDFGDPERIHGTEMPGLAVLRNSAGSLAVEYQARGDGAELTFTSADPAVVAALHDWFAAQTSDHGRHAE